jgi:phenylpyruvate tautomerase PptA (4-oxalocrotonate tautomerase family)
MARYLVQVPRDVLAESRKAEVAKAIVAAHHKITGDDPDSVQVAVTEIDAGCFVAGATAERKQALIARLSDDVTKAADFDLDSTWATISEL